MVKAVSKILCTGGAGFIGSHVVDKLYELGHEVVVIDDLSTGDLKNIKCPVEVISNSVTDDLSYIFDKYKFDYVFHLAAQINLRDSINEPSKDARINILGSINIIENCYRHGVKKLIFSSTGGAIYSPDEPLPWDTKSKADPQSPYGLSKLTVEKYLQLAKQLHGLEYVSLRYSNVFGPRQNSKGEAGVISIFINNILKNKDIIIFGSGSQTRDFVYVKDVVSANALSLKEDISGIYNVSTNTEYDVNTIANFLLNKMRATTPVVHGEAIKGELMRSRLCYDKLAAYGWQPNYDLETGLEETIDFFKSNVI